MDQARILNLLILCPRPSKQGGRHCVYTLRAEPIFLAHAENRLWVIRVLLHLMPTLPQTYMNIGPTLFDILATDRQTNRQTHVKTELPGRGNYVR